MQPNRSAQAGADPGVEGPSIWRFLGSVIAVIGGLPALSFLFTGGSRCDDRCHDPNPGVSWRNTQDAWQWDVLIGTGLVVLLAGCVAFWLSQSAPLRPRALIAALSIEGLGVAIGVAVVNLS